MYHSGEKRIKFENSDGQPDSRWIDVSFFMLHLNDYFYDETSKTQDAHKSTQTYIPSQCFF